MLVTVVNLRFSPILNAWSKSKATKKPKECNNNHGQIKREYEGRRRKKNNINHNIVYPVRSNNDLLLERERATILSAN